MLPCCLPLAGAGGSRLFLLFRFSVAPLQTVYDRRRLVPVVLLLQVAAKSFQAFVAPRQTASEVKFQVGKAKIDSDATPLLFFQTVSINAGQGFDQRGLAVVNVSGGADDDRFH